MNEDVACMNCRRFQNGGWCYWGNEVEMRGYDPVIGEYRFIKDKAFPIGFLNGAGQCKHFQAKEKPKEQKGEVDGN